MSGWGNFGTNKQTSAKSNNKPKNEQDFFTRPSNNLNNNLNLLKFINSPQHPKMIYLLHPDHPFKVFQFIDKNFTITTNNGTYKFNTDFLKETSPLIKSILDKNPHDLEYHYNPKDERKIMAKIEKMYNGEQIEVLDNEKYGFNQVVCEIQIDNNFKSLENERLLSQGGNWQNKAKFGISKGNRTCYKGLLELNKANFKKFLTEKYKNTFTIITKSKEYKCNKIGVRSSNVINDFLLQNPNSSEFVYDFDDEFGEFQSFCDLFNFEYVTIDANNMDTIKMIADELQTECVLGEIDKFIDDYHKRVQMVDDQQSIMDSINELFHTIFKIKEITVNIAKQKIIDSNWSKTEENVIELAAFILQAVKTDILLHPYLADLIESLDKESDETNKLNILLPFIIDKLMNAFGESHFISSFIFILHQKGFIQKVDILNKLNSNINNSISYSSCAFFLPEVYEVCNSDLQRLLSNYPSNIHSLIDSYFPDNIEMFKKMRESGEPDDPITKALRSDDVDTLQTIISQNHIDIEEAKVPYNIFDEFITSGQTKYINYSAAYGSIKCFKYLLLNHAEITDSTFSKALYGGNIEIIKIVDQQTSNSSPKPYKSNKKFNDKSKLNENPLIYSTIIKHQNDLFDWILDQKNADIIKQKDTLRTILLFAAENGDCHSFATVVDKGLDFSIFEISICQQIVQNASKNGFYKLLEIITKLMKKRIEDNATLYDSNSALYFGNLSIFKLYIEKGSKIDFNNALLYSAENNYKSFIEYIINNHKDKCKIDNNFIEKLISKSFTLKTEDLLEYLIEKFKNFDENPFLTFSTSLSIDLLSKACISSKFGATKIITNLIMEYKKDDEKVLNFSLPFYNAMISRSPEICQFFIDEKVFIDFDLIAYQIKNVVKCKKDVLEIFINNMKPSTKNILITCYLVEAINNKNKYLVDYLLKENAFDYKALIEAVKTDDIEIVNMILNKNSEPYFINQIISKQTALSLAVSYKSLEIVKRLLSIPGIDTISPAPNYSSPLVIAIQNFDIEMMNQMLDFYGSNIQSQIWQLNEAFRSFVNTIPNLITQEKNPNIPKVLKKLIEIKGIDFNYSSNEYTLLRYACETNEIEIVEKLIELEDVDVNVASNDGDTPLIIALLQNNLEIAELLINCNRTNINHRNNLNQTPLLISIKGDLDEIIDLIINNEKFDPVESRLNEAFDICGDHISLRLISIKNTNMNSLLDSKMVDFEFISSISNGNLDTSKKLIESGKVDINKRYDNNKTALVESVKNCNIYLTDLIINDEKFDPIKSRLDYAFYISKGEISKKLISIKGLDVNYQEILYINPIFSSNKKNKGLLNEFSYFNASGLLRTTLMKAVAESNYEKIDLIINHPSFDIHKSFVKEAIVSACKKSIFSKDYFIKLTTLINNDINFTDNQGNSLLHAVLESNNEGLLNEIITNEKFHINDEDFRSSFYQYLQKNDQLLTIIITLLQYTKKHNNLIDFKQNLKSGKSYFTAIFKKPLQMYYNYGYIHKDNDANSETDALINKIIELLIENGADPNMPDNEGIYPLEHAINVSNDSFAKALIKSNKIDFSVKLKSQKSPQNSFLGFYSTQSSNKKDRTYLHLAAAMGRESIVSLLLNEQSIDINAKDSLGDTPLMDACKTQNSECVKLFFKMPNLDYTQCNNAGDDALQVTEKLLFEYAPQKPKTKDEYQNSILNLIKRRKSNSKLKYGYFNVPKEDETKEKETKESEAKEKETKEDETKDKETKESEAKDKETKENEAKDKEAKENEDKDKETKENEVKENETKDIEAKESEAKDKETKENEVKENETKESEAKDKEAKESEAKEKEAKENEVKENEAKENKPTENGTKENENKGNDNVKSESNQLAQTNKVKGWNYHLSTQKADQIDATKSSVSNQTDNWGASAPKRSKNRISNTKLRDIKGNNIWKLLSSTQKADQTSDAKPSDSSQTKSWGSSTSTQKSDQTSDSKPSDSNQTKSWKSLESTQKADQVDGSKPSDSSQTKSWKSSTSTQKSDQTSDSKHSDSNQTKSWESSNSTQKADQVDDSKPSSPQNAKAEMNSPSSSSISNGSAIQDEIIAAIRDSLSNVTPDEVQKISERLSSILEKREEKADEPSIQQKPPKETVEEIKPKNKFKSKEKTEDDDIKEERNQKQIIHQPKPLIPKARNDFENYIVTEDDQNQLNFLDDSFYQNQMDQQQWDMMIQMNNMRNAQFNMIMYQQELMMKMITNETRTKKKSSSKQESKKKKKKSHK